MTTNLHLQIPDSLHKSLVELARHDGVSPDQFVASAIAEKIAALKTVDYLQQRAKRGSRKKYEKVLAKVADRKPAAKDRLR
jgi:hypothetical protein